VTRALGLVVLLLLCGCGSVARVNTGTAPSPSVSAPPSVVASSTPSPTPAPPGTRLTVTGAIAGAVSGASAFGDCGRTANGAGADLRFQLNGQAFSLSITLSGFHGAGTYSLPPERVSLHTLVIGPTSRFFGSTSGTVTTVADGGSGTVDSTMTGDNGTVHVSGTWSCAS
jgi:hypothetical protein